MRLCDGMGMGLIEHSTAAVAAGPVTMQHAQVAGSGVVARSSSPCLIPHVVAVSLAAATMRSRRVVLRTVDGGVPLGCLSTPRHVLRCMVVGTALQIESSP